jgi:hypothetical protein
MNFNWEPSGQYSNFRLEIRLKAPQLRGCEGDEAEQREGNLLSAD